MWNKTNPMPRNIERRYVQSLEYIIWAVKKKSKWTFNKIKEPYLKPVFEYPICMGNERTEHPTQKPIAILKELLLIHTNEYDNVLDPFIGSGSTAVACELTNRNCYGCELNKTYFDIANERIKEARYNLFKED